MKLSNTNGKGTPLSTPQSNPRDDEITIMDNMDRIMELLEENRKLQRGENNE